MSTHLLYTAETRHSEGDYLSALEYFDRGIKELEKNHKQSNHIWAWAWAHMGESHLALAESLDHLNPAKDQHYDLSLYSFNKAIGVKKDQPENPKIKLANEDLKVYDDCNYAWAFAHRGEALRVIANNWPSLHKADRYEEAIK